MKLGWMAAAVAVAGFSAIPGAQAQQFINVLTGGTSGVYYPLGVAIGKIYGDKIPGVKTQVQATKASVENLVLLDQGRGEIGCRHIGRQVVLRSLQQIDLRVTRSGTAVLQQSGASTANVPLTASFMVAQEDRHVVAAKLSRAAAVPARIYIKVDYQGPATSTLF